MNVSTESMVNFCPMHVYLVFKKSSYIGLVKFSSAERKKKQYVYKQNSEQNSKGNKCENTCIFPNGYNPAMDNGEYKELWNLNWR